MMSKTDWVMLIVIVGLLAAMVIIADGADKQPKPAQTYTIRNLSTGEIAATVQGQGVVMDMGQGYSISTPIEGESLTLEVKR